MKLNSKKLLHIGLVSLSLIALSGCLGSSSSDNRIYKVAKAVINEGNDDVNERILTRTFDKDGNILTFKRESLRRDGSLYISTDTATYDNNGNRLTEENSQGDGSKYLITRTFDEDGNVLSREDSFDGTFRQKQSYEYDDKGNKILEASFDENGNITFKLEKTYDDNGNVTEVKYYSDGVNLSSKHQTTNTYDDNGNLTLTEFERHEDGIIDFITFFEYDDNGNLTKKMTDRDGDNDSNREPDQIWHYSYDENGNKTQIDNDYNGDRVINQSSIKEYDSNNNLTYSAVDRDGEGPEGRTRILKITYDERGNKIKEERDFRGNGEFSTSGEWEYNSSNKLTKFSRDFSDDGTTPSYIETRDYDKNGNLKIISIDRNGDGETNDIGTFTWIKTANKYPEEENTGRAVRNFGYIPLSLDHRAR